MTGHTIGTREEWLAAREELLKQEKEQTRLGERSRGGVGTCPGCGWRRTSRFDTDDGEKSLVELFDGGRNARLPLHVRPELPGRLPGQLSIVDSIDGVVPHLHARDATLFLVSQAPLEKLQGYKRRMGWSIPWVRPAGDFNFDLGFSQTEEQPAKPWRRSPCRPGVGGRVPADRRAQRPRVRHRRRRLPHREPGLHVRPGRRRCLPRVLDNVARIGVPHNLLPDPRPRAEGARRGESDWQL